MILENRDPNGVIKNNLGTRFNQVISEPKQLESTDLFWYPSTLCYDRWRLFVYQCLSFLTGPCITNFFAYIIGYSTFLLVWVVQPFCRLQESCVESFVVIIGPLLRGRCLFFKNVATSALRGSISGIGNLFKKTGSNTSLPSIDL